MTAHDSAAAVPLHAPRTLCVETPNFVFRTLTEDDDLDSLRDWLFDPYTQSHLNTVGRRLTVDEVRAYVRSFDGVKTHIFGIFHKESGRLVGMRNAYINAKRSEGTLNTLVGDVSNRGKGAQRESRYPLYQFLFEELDLRSLLANVVADNAYMLQNLKNTGWKHEGTSFKQRAGGPGLVEIHHFRLTRGEWRNVEAAKAKLFVLGYA